MRCQQFARAVLRAGCAVRWQPRPGGPALASRPAKDKAHLDEWLKAVAPSDELRRWYGHQPVRFAEFKRRYEAELKDPERAEALRHLRAEARSGPVTLLTASKDLEHSEAAVLAQLLRSAQGTPQ